MKTSMKSFINFCCRAFLLIILIGTSSHCAKDDPTIIKPGTEYGNQAKSVLGRGYDICDRFAHTESIKEAVLDFDKLAKNDKMIRDPNIASTEVRTLEGETIQAYQSSFSYAQTLSAGIKGLFSAEAGVNFGYKHARESNRSFATVSSFTYKYGMYIDGRSTPKDLSEYVSAKFLSDAKKMDPEQFIKSYGTHVVVGGKWGASFDYSMSAIRKSQSSTYSFGAFVKADATLKGINLGGSTNIHSEFSTYYENNSKSVYAKAKGGDSEYVLAIAAATDKGLDEAYLRWIETIDKNPVFCDYYREGLIPIYDFITDESLRNKLKGIIDPYLDDNKIESAEPVDDYIRGSFTKIDFCKQVSGKDGNIRADGNGPIYVEVTFSIVQKQLSNNLELKIEMKIHENKGDNTKLEGTTTALIANNKPINSIELSNTSYTFTIEHNFHEFDFFDPFKYLKDPPPDWIYDIRIRIDHKTDANSGKHAGVKGQVKIPVTVWK